MTARPRHTISLAFVVQLERAQMIAACAEDYDHDALPIFERIDREFEAVRAKVQARALECPLESARALVKARAGA